MREEKERTTTMLWRRQRQLGMGYLIFATYPAIIVLIKLQND